MNRKEEPGKRHHCIRCRKGFHDYWEKEAHEKKCLEEQWGEDCNCCKTTHGGGEDGHP